MNEETIKAVLDFQREKENLESLVHILQSRNDVRISTENQFKEAYWLNSNNLLRSKFLELVMKQLEEVQKALDNL